MRAEEKTGQVSAQKVPCGRGYRSEDILNGNLAVYILQKPLPLLANALQPRYCLEKILHFYNTLLST
jgi:hypothetical protein